MVAASVTEEPNEEETAHFFVLLNEYARTGSAEALQAIEQLPMPTGYLNARYLHAETGRYLGEINRRDGIPVGARSIATSATCFERNGHWIGAHHVPGGDRGVLQVALTFQSV